MISKQILGLLLNNLAQFDVLGIFQMLHNAGTRAIFSPFTQQEKNPFKLYT